MQSHWHPFLTRFLIQSFLMAKPDSVKAWLCPFNNEVWVGTVRPLCCTRTDPRGDFLVVMVLMQQSLPQRPESTEFYYRTHTHTHSVWLNKEARWAKCLTHFQVNWNKALKIDLITLFTATSQLGSDWSAFFDLTDRFCAWQVFFFAATNCQIIGLQSKQNEDC